MHGNKLNIVIMIMEDIDITKIMLKIKVKNKFDFYHSCLSFYALKLQVVVLMLLEHCDNGATLVVHLT